MKKIIITLMIITISIYTFAAVNEPLKNAGFSLLFPGTGLHNTGNSKGGYIFNAVEITGIIVSGFMYFSSDYYESNALDFGSIAFNKDISAYDERILMKMELYENSDYYNSLLSSKARDIYPDDTEKQEEYISTNTIPDSLAWEWDNDDVETFYFMRKQSRVLKQYFIYSISAITVNHLTSAIFTFFNVNKKMQESIPDVSGFYDGTNFVLNVGMNF
ncbi:hypothetical protein KAU15_05635 [candidate division WOR-3 bacterium]|nr:hypothetical protein [candidate division WOR-3 bacterium]